MNYLMDLGERVLGAFVAGVLSVLGVDALNIVTADWGTALSVGVGAAVLSLLKGLAARYRGDHESASLRVR